MPRVTLRTDFLYARPSFLEGMARIVDLGGTLNEYHPFSPEIDQAAICMDWAMIGQDLRHAIGDFKIDRHQDRPKDPLRGP